MTSFLEKTEYYKFIRLRQRYIFNRQGRMRIRYIAGTAACALLIGVTALGGPVGSFATRMIDSGSQFLPSASMQVASAPIADQPEAADVPDLIQDKISDSMRRAPQVLQKAAKRDDQQEIEIGRGDTLAGVLQEAGVSGADAYNVMAALKDHVDPRVVKPGQKLMVHFKPGSVSAGNPEFAELTMRVSPVKEVVISKAGDDFKAKMTEKELVKKTYAGEAKIETSLYGSAARAGIPSQVVAEAIRIYSWNIDFQRDIQPGDKIEVLYEAQETEDGQYAKFGNLIYANLTVNGKDVPIYRYEMSDGRADYFQPNGYSIRNTLMKTPIDGARVSSGFGMRRHPVLGYTKMHKGVDFAAPTGTPIYAAGDGTLEYAGRFSTFGNYIRIRHNSQLKTAYAHMNRLASGMRVGERVHQGEVIGYVGTTGRSTGPHLHYEVLVNNDEVNPNSVNLPTGEQLTGKAFQKFKSWMNTVHQQYVSLRGGYKFAMFGGSDTPKDLN